MAETRVLGRDMQEEFFKTVRRGEEFVLVAIKMVAERMHPYAPKRRFVYPPLAERLPKPKEVVEITYDFAEKLLANQRKFAEDMLAAAAPLAPAVKSNGHAPKARSAGK